MKVHGVVRPPGDKSISHRALLVGALAREGRGQSEFTGLLAGEDVKSTARVLRQLGAEISPVRDGATVSVTARSLAASATRLHCGNSGTTARLLLGVLAGQRFKSTLTGDASLRRRPMRRVTEPLRAMGAHIVEERGETLPLAIRGGGLHALSYTTPIASAQVKSALLLAALTGKVALTVREPYRSRDHTERLFVHLGLDLRERDGAISFQPSTTGIAPFQLSVPGDASSAAFLVAAAALSEGGELLVENVGVNPTRTGFLVVLERMGAHVERVNLRDAGGEPVADLLVRPASALRGTEVTAPEIPTLVDEVPVLAVVASRAAGETVFREVGELRVKESNRLELVAANLRALGVDAAAAGNDLHVRGTERPPKGTIETARDHRLAMAFAVLGTVPGAEVRLSERRSVAISYPGFFEDLRRIGRNARHHG
jgi:3-phosphoshikimate 1-carboxyvinyltransferase